ncbi:MAG: SDR family NAD(P)-dependent oxidoreductase [Flammeovirgaceae bacterium]
MLNFTGKNILIVGASSGIGEELANLLIASGANVYSVSRKNPNIAGVVHETLDVTNFDKTALNQLPDTLHGLAYCPGSITLKPFVRLKEDDFLSDFEINVLGAVRVIQAVLPKLKKAKGSQVVLFSTVATAVGMNFHASIAAAKGAVEGLAKSLAAEFAINKITVNAIAPSLTDTPLAASLLATDERRANSAKRHPLGRVGVAHDVASLAAYLLSGSAGWISGQTIGVDGGMSTIRNL